VKCYGVAVAMPQGQSWAPPSSSESTVNTGTVSILALSRASSAAVGPGSSSTDRVGTGRSRRSTPSRGKPVHMGKGGSSFEKGRRL